MKKCPVCLLETVSPAWVSALCFSTAGGFRLVRPGGLDTQLPAVMYLSLLTSTMCCCVAEWPQILSASLTLTVLQSHSEGIKYQVVCDCNNE